MICVSETLAFQKAKKREDLSIFLYRLRLCGAGIMLANSRPPGVM